MHGVVCPDETSESPPIERMKEACSESEKNDGNSSSDSNNLSPLLGSDGSL